MVALRDVIIGTVGHLGPLGGENSFIRHTYYYEMVRKAE